MNTNPLGSDLKSAITATTSLQQIAPDFDDDDANSSNENESSPPVHKTEPKSETASSPSAIKEAPTFSANASGGGKGSGGKQGPEKKINISVDDKNRTETDGEITELLGSVTTQNCPGTRTSARVIQKMKQDQTRPTTPPNDRDQRRDDKGMQKTPSQVRAHKPSWTNLERNHFFDALNEFGKDFDSIGNYINSKLKRKSSTDFSFKTKDQVRQHYYQTYHKICKYLKFSDEVKKPAQELYALINYGEMRRKLQFVTDKHFMKLKNLIYQGYVTVRCKGKNIRIKTPSCKALRRLNQLDDSLEDIRLPSKIEVIVNPANMEAFGRVQTIAQNPRVRTTVPLHKKLVNFIKTFQYKWRSPEVKLAEEAAKLFPSSSTPSIGERESQNGTMPGESLLQDKPYASGYHDSEMCFLPKPGVIIHRPLLSITEYLSSVNICLTAYEERMGLKVRSGSLCQQDRPIGKRQRTESGSEKRSPDTKKPKQFNSPTQEKDMNISDIREETASSQDAETLHVKCESSSDELSDEIHELLTETESILKEESCLAGSFGHGQTISSTSSSALQQARSKRVGTNAKTSRSTLSFKPLISEDVIHRIRKGWTVSNAADITIGDLYVVLGHDSKLELEYYWTDRALGESSMVSDTSEMTPTDSASSFFMQKQNGMPYNPSECEDVGLLKTISTSSVANKLKHLLLIANLNERMRKRQCSCGHTCERSITKTRVDRDLATKTFVSTKTFTPNSSSEGNNLFRQPVVPVRRPIFTMDPMKQMNTLTRQRLSRQMIVQRLLLPDSANHSYDMLDARSGQHSMNASSQIESQMPTKHEHSYFNDLQTASIALPSTSITTLPTSTSPLDNTDSSPMTDSSITPEINTRGDFSHSQNEPTTTTSRAKSPLITMASMSTTPNSLASTSNPPLNADQQHSGEKSEMSEPLNFSESTFDECSNTSVFNNLMSPMHLLRESTSNSRWLEENLNDFSLTSLLGHLDEINASRDILDPSSNLSVISESSVDYRHKFQEITALMRSQDKD